MICKSCNIRHICITYDFIVNQKHAEIEVKSCNYNSSPKAFSDFVDNLEPINKDKKINNPNYMGQARQDLKDLEKQLNPQPEKPEPVKVTCPSCEGTTYDDDLMVCKKCGKIVCSNCGTIAEGKVFCNPCWEEE
jgi:protein-arginine kinase activator protein McsA